MTLSERHAQILSVERELDAALLRRYGVASLDKGDGNDWISIPYFENGEVVNHKYRTIGEHSGKRFYQDAEARKTFWNVDVLRDKSLASEPLVITEGELDALTAIQCGWRRTVSVPDGAPSDIVGDKTDSSKYEYVDNAQSLLAPVREIIVATDGDKAGQNLLNDLVNRLGRARCRWVKYPLLPLEHQGAVQRRAKDLNEVYCGYVNGKGHRAVHETLSRAPWIRLDGIYKINDFPAKPDFPVYRVGIEGLGSHYRVRLGDFVVVTGIPSHGKTALVNDIVAHLVEDSGFRAVIASFEQEPVPDHRRNLRTWFHRKPEEDQTEQEREEADSWIQDNFTFISPPEDVSDFLHDNEPYLKKDEPHIDLEWLLVRCARAVRRDGARIVVVDPWNEMDHIRPNGMSMTDYVSFAIKEFRRFARQFRVHFIVVAHPHKLEKNEDGQYDCPTLYDISDSAHWYNKPAIGIIVFRTKDRTMVRIAKVRYQGVIGYPGDVWLRFMEHEARFGPSVDPKIEDAALGKKPRKRNKKQTDMLEEPP